MSRTGSRLLRADGPAVLAWGLLVLMGLFTLYSCTVDYRAAGEVVESTVSRGVFYSQLTWVGLGSLLALLAVSIPHRHYETLAYPAYVVTLLALLLVFAMPDRAGTQRWITLGAFSLQPSEPAKLAVVFALARFLGSRASRNPWLSVAGATVIVLPPTVLVLLEPDLGTSLVYPALAVPMLFWAGVPALFLVALASPVIGAFVMFYGQQVLGSTWPWVLYILAFLGLLWFSRLYLLQSVLLVSANVVTGLSIPLVWERLKPYQQARILSFFSPGEADRLGSGYQSFQSKVAIGSGGVLGKGYMEGSQKGLAFLPARHTDFIFSVIGEELGLWGAALLLALFLLLVYRALRIAMSAKKPFGSLVAIGVGTYFAFQSLVNISITAGLLPVTGLPLPFISYGGSSMLASCLMVGVLLSIAARWSEV